MVHEAEISPTEQLENNTPPADNAQSLIDIVTLAETNNEMLLTRVSVIMRFVGLQQGSLEIALTGNAPDTLAGDLAKQLFQWTGQRWLVSLSDKDGAETLAEHTAKAAAKTHNTIAADPLITKIIRCSPAPLLTP